MRGQFSSVGASRRPNVFAARWNAIAGRTKAHSARANSITRRGAMTDPSWVYDDLELVVRGMSAGRGYGRHHPPNVERDRGIMATSDVSAIESAGNETEKVLDTFPDDLRGPVRDFLAQHGESNTLRVQL